MLFAASIRVTLGRNHRRIDVIVEANSPEEASDKAIKHARKIYYPGKKATYQILNLLSETEAFQVIPEQASSPTVISENSL